MLGVLILSEKACLLEFSVFLFFIKVKNKTKNCYKGRMKNKVTESFKIKFLIPEILDKLSELHTNEILVRWGMAVQERMAGKLEEKNEMRGTLMRRQVLERGLKEDSGKLERIQKNK